MAPPSALSPCSGKVHWVLVHCQFSKRTISLSDPDSYTPDLFQPFMGIGDAILNQKDFGPRARELVILAVMAVYDCPFVLYAHTRIAVKGGLSEEQVALACKGVVPTSLTETEGVIYVTALELARSR